MAAPKPILLAMVLCDMVIRESGTNKLSLIGTFSGLYTPSFPCVHPSLTVYVALTEGRGILPFKLRLVSEMDNRPLFELPEGKIDFNNPAHVGELVIQINQVRFEKPGFYAIEFWGGDDLLGLRKLNVQRLPRQGGMPPADPSRLPQWPSDLK